MSHSQGSDETQQIASSQNARPPSLIIAIDGPSGAGKSTVGKTVARRLGYLFIDSGAVYRAVALKALEGGQAAIVDAVHAKESEREATAQLASPLSVPFVGIWLDAPAEVLRKRVAERSGDVSDATPEVVDAQLGYKIGRQCFQVVDAGRPLDQVVAECLGRIGVEPRNMP